MRFIMRGLRSPVVFILSAIGLTTIGTLTLAMRSASLAEAADLSPLNPSPSDLGNQPYSEGRVVSFTRTYPASRFEGRGDVPPDSVPNTTYTPGYGGLTHQVVLINPVDGRMTFEKYAVAKMLDLSDVRRRFGATGKLNCNGHVSTAQLTGKADVISFAGHAAFNPDCTKKTALICTFTLDASFPEKEKEYSLDMRSMRVGRCSQSTRAGDWGTAKLNERVPHVVPYGVPAADAPDTLSQGQRLIQVSYRHTNFRLGSAYPKTIEECAVRAAYLRSYDPIQTDCNTGGWSSGSAQLVRELTTGRLIVAAINVAENAVSAAGSGYDPDRLYNISVELRGEFLGAVRENLR